MSNETAAIIGVRFTSRTFAFAAAQQYIAKVNASGQLHDVANYD